MYIKYTCMHTFFIEERKTMKLGRKKKESSRAIKCVEDIRQ